MALAGEQPARSEVAKHAVAGFCFHPGTGEQIERPADEGDACPDGYLSYIDTPQFEWVNGAPPPSDRVKDRAETAADAK